MKSIVALVLCIEAVGHCNTLFSVFILCERNAKIKRIMIVVTVVCYSIPCAILIKYLDPTIHNTPFVALDLGTLEVRVCASQVDTKLALALWLPPVFVDVCAIALLLWNAMDRPRTLNVRITELLTQDGIVIIVVGCVLRFSVIVISASANLTSVLVTDLFIEFINAALNTRLFLMLRGRMVTPTCDVNSFDESMDDHQDFAAAVPRSRFVQDEDGE
ncbi:hypothetical protein SCHPADRAFT_646027 [Schizopora paradoxa]|uniref:G-protein coupled receptors family 1 profile domain-containing protein n=1 Tax=Schizopora paradoxa TaxID=27342 RepID=A0A0H2R815_9AGAM|nr:hypothetical protein SCHPADRAFT_646027 [Schizopora paradoxa]